VVGLLAGSGYAIAAHLLNVRMQTWMVLLIALLQLWAYFAGSFIEFKARGPLYFTGTNQRVSFFEDYHLRTINMRWASSSPGDSPSANPPAVPPGPGTMNPAPPTAPEGLGLWGYGVRLVDVLGFAIGCMILPVIQRSQAYCDLCQRYMKTKTLLELPASKKLRSFRINSIDHRAPENQAMLAEATAAMQEAAHALETGNVSTFWACIERYSPPGAQNAPLVALLNVTYCPQCKQGLYKTLLKQTQSKTSQVNVLGKGDLRPEIIAAVVGE
jgi:hypothetical protein